MNLNITSILQNPSQTNQIQAGPNAGRSTGVVLEDSASVTWTTDGFGNIQAAAAGGGSSLPTATAAGQVPVSTGPGTTYTAQTPAMQLIQKYVSPGSVATITLASIPQTFTHLQLVISGTNGSGAPQSVLVNFSGDASANYSYQYVTAAGAAVTAANGAAQTSGLLGDLHNFGAGAIRALITNYTAATAKAVEATGTYINPGFNYNTIQAGTVWASASSISSIVLSLSNSATFNSDVVVSLYGLL